jgi:uncharacterized GH25 family protein
MEALHVYRGVRSRYSPVTTDDEGRFLKGGLTAERYDVLAEAPGREPVRVPDVPPGTGDLVLVLQPAATAVVRLVGSADGEPLTDATVVGHRRTGLADWRERHVRSPLVVERGTAAQAADGIASDAGVFVLTGLGRQGSEVIVSAPGHETRGFRLPGVEAPGTLFRKLALRRESVLAGRVVDDVGVPIGGAKVVLSSPGTVRYAVDPVDTRTDSAGRFRFGALKTGDWELTATRRGYLKTEGRPVHVDAQTVHDDVDVVLQRGSEVRGVVRTPRGEPVAGVQVSVWRRNPEREDNSWFRSTNSTDDEGRFALLGLRPGVWTLRVEPGVAVELDLEPAQGVEVELTLREPPRVHGRVAAGGVPLEGAEVRADPTEAGDMFARAKPITTKTDALGDYRLQIQPQGAWSLVARWPAGGRSAPVALDLAWGDDRLVDLALGVGLVEGRVTDEGGGVPDGLEVRLLVDGATAADWASLAADGRFAYEHLRPGDYVVQARGGAYALAASPPFVITSDERHEGVAVVVHAGARIEGRVVDASGQPTGAWVYVHRPDAATPEQLGAPKGAFTLGGLSAGAYRVVIADVFYLEALQSGGAQPYGAPNVLDEEAFTLDDGEVREVELRMPESGS